MSILGVFAVIGLLAGAAARLLFPGREVKEILSTLLIGATGSLVGGMFSWTIWPVVEDGPIYPGALLTSLLGAVVALGVAFVVLAVRNHNVAVAQGRAR